MKQTLYIQAKDDFRKPLQVELYDLTGKMITRQQVFKNDFSIDVTPLKSGVYILKMFNGYDIDQQVYKVVKQ